MRAIGYLADIIESADRSQHVLVEKVHSGHLLRFTDTDEIEIEGTTFSTEAQDHCIAIYSKKPTLQDIADTLINNSAENIVTSFVLEQRIVQRKGNFFKPVGRGRKRKLDYYGPDTTERLRYLCDAERALDQLTSGVSYFDPLTNEVMNFVFRFGFEPKGPFEYGAYVSVGDPSEAEKFQLFGIQSRELGGPEIHYMRDALRTRLERLEQKVSHSTKPAVLDKYRNTREALGTAMHGSSKLLVGKLHPDSPETADLGMLRYAVMVERGTQPQLFAETDSKLEQCYAKRA